MPAPLYLKYPRQTSAQDAYIEIELGGNSTPQASPNYEIGNAVPFDVWHNRTIRISVDNSVDGDALDELLSSERFAELVAIARADYATEWDGNNYVGRLTNAGEEALDEIQELADDLPTLNVWSPDDWINAVLKTTPEGLYALDGVVITEKNLAQLLDEYREEEGDNVIPGLHDLIRYYAEQNALVG